MKMNPGDNIWVVERDENGEPVDYSGHVFICEVNGYCIVSAFINGNGDIDYVLGYQADCTASDFTSELSVYPTCDCYPDRESAESAMHE